MTYKLMCTDIDGTLLNKDRELSVATISEVKRIQNKIPVILISSRMPKAMRHLQEQLDILELPLIAYNGGLIMNQGEILETTEINNGVLANTISICKNTKIHLSLYNNDDWYVPSMDYWAKREEHNTKVTPKTQALEKTLENWSKSNIGAHKIMAMGDENEIQMLFDSLTKLHGDSISLYRSKPTYIEIASKQISKETAIQTLLNDVYPSIEMKDIIAFGDNYNDIEMLKAVGMGVAVANAKTEVLDIANDTTDTNKNDGVAKSIGKHIL